MILAATILLVLLSNCYTRQLQLPELATRFHVKLITDTKLDLIRQGDLDVLVELDRHGLLMGPGETVAAFAERLETLRRNLQQFTSEIDAAGEIEVFDISLEKSSTIPRDAFRSAQQLTGELYDFEIDWVPGFYTNKRMGLLFAGCALYSSDDYFALFIVRKAFEKRERWLIYSRTELLAHELCHIAHMGFNTVDFEEMFAYQTSPSRFRRAIGGLFRTPMDSYAVLGSAFLLAGAQIVNRLYLGMVPIYQFPISLFAMIVIVCFGVVGGRYLKSLSMYGRARARLRELVDEAPARAILFRCSGAEIREIAHTAEPRAWLTAQADQDIRWRVILHKYPFR